MDDKLKESVIGFDALYESMMKCKRGVLWKDSTASFFLHACERILSLHNSLKDGTYKPRPVVHFKVTSPKEREIASIAFCDRVYQRSLNDNVVYPAMTRGFIYDNYACQKGKGTDKARERLKEFLRSYYRQHGSEGYICRFDIKGYYSNMNHGLVEDMLRAKLDSWAFEQVKRILNEQYEGDKGYNPGSQLVQIVGISFLDKLDHFVKEKLHIKYYIRYMDDFLLIHHDKEYLEECKEKIIEELHKIKLDVNPKKTGISDIKDGIEFLGFNYHLTETGKVLMFITPQSVKREKKKLYRLIKRSKEGYLPKESVDKSFETWINFLSKGNHNKLIYEMRKYYSSLWEKEEM